MIREAVHDNGCPWSIPVMESLSLSRLAIARHASPGVTTESLSIANLARP